MNNHARGPSVIPINVSGCLLTCENWKSSRRKLMEWLVCLPGLDLVHNHLPSPFSFHFSCFYLVCVARRGKYKLWYLIFASVWYMHAENSDQ